MYMYMKNLCTNKHILSVGIAWVQISKQFIIQMWLTFRVFNSVYVSLKYIPRCCHATMKNITFNDILNSNLMIQNLRRAFKQLSMVLVRLSCTTCHTNSPVYRQCHLLGMSRPNHPSLGPSQHDNVSLGFIPSSRSYFMRNSSKLLCLQSLMQRIPCFHGNG